MEAIVTQVAMRLGLEEMKRLNVEGPRLLFCNRAAGWQANG